MWRTPQGFSGDALEPIFCTLWGRLVEEEVECTRVKGVGFSCAKFPKRCISRETSFESYVRPIELCQRPKGGASVRLIRLRGSGAGG